MTPIPDSERDRIFGNWLAAHRARRRNVARKRELEALLKELEGQ